MLLPLTASAEDSATPSEEMAKQHFSFALQNKKSGNMKEAVVQYEKSLSYDDSVYQVHYSYADLLLEMNKKDDARRHYLKSYNLNHGHFNSAAMLSRLYYEAALYDSSLIMYERMFELAPEHTEFLQSIARLRTFLGDTNGAYNAWDSLFKTNAGTVGDMLDAAHLAYDEDNQEKTAEYAIMALEKEPDNREALQLAAKSMLTKGETDKSVEYYRCIAEQDSTDGTVLLQLERLYRSLNDREGLLWALEHRLAIAPDSVAIIGEIATILTEDGHTERSLQYIHKGLEIQPNDGRLRILLGEYYRTAGEKDKALTQYRKALSDSVWKSSAEHMILLVEHPETAEEKAERDFFKRGATTADEQL